MNDERPDDESELQRQIDDLRERMTANRADIDSLLGRADAANHRSSAIEARADAAEQRADVIEERAAAADRRADVSEELSADDRRRISELEAHVDVDRAMILELRAEGLISQQHAEQLQEALRTSRRIGAAIGIVMASRKVNETDAFLLLTRASQNTNRKVRVVADEVVETGDISDLPGS
ncbi:ANTAR domain-containing protein [Microlunatus ginsengisoli]|uniref:ANTAR domain-containing protein n=1 Tax=Microlunatus ginsengisoli TaxID=363863 RepID=A0ABP7AKE4_9ACTN